MSLSKFNLDWDFISELEGKLIAKGYVPMSGHSGVTIASGFDIGNHSIQDLVDMRLPQDLVTKLHIYTEVKGDQAVKVLNEKPLFLNQDELNELDTCVKQYYAENVEHEFDTNATHELKFCDLDQPKQTVICSVSFQYGSLKKKCPQFFRAITQGLWKAAVEELQNFGDAYKQRRLKEAALLKSSL